MNHSVTIWYHEDIQQHVNRHIVPRTFKEIISEWEAQEIQNTYHSYQITIDRLIFLFTLCYMKDC